MATWTLFFLAVATFLGASHAGHGGREFVLAFMQNYRSSRNTKLELLITAYQGSTKVNVMQQKLQKSLFVKKGDTISFSVMELEEIFNAGRSDQTVLVRSDKDISVSTFSNKPYTVDASVIYPVQSLGTEYIVFTPPTGLASQLKEFAVSNTGQENAVKVTLKQRMFFEQHWYNAGQDIKLVLKPYETVQFQNKQDLTGTQVRAQHPVALTAGHTCSAVSGNCNHVYEQLRPVNSWGTEFAVAPSKTQKGNDWVYVLASQATVLNAEGREWEMSPLQVLKFNVNQDHPLYITASKGVQVLYYSTGRTKGYDPYFMTVVPSQDFAESYWVRGLKNFENHISIVAKTAEVSQILLEGKKMTKNIKWHPIPRSPYSWTDVKTGRKQESHLLASKSGERFGVYKYGVEKRNGYGTQGSAVGRGENSGDPCSVVRCRSETQCSVVDGAAVCVPTSSAICWAWGDPHYHTFDGLNFDFQGTCTYTIAKSCSNDPSLPVFTISAKNDNRGNRKVSYVRTIKVNVYGFNISVRKWEYGLVRVNGIKTHLPVSLNDGQVTLYESGVSVTIETDFYLRVSYDWNHHLVVEVSSLHSGNVCGLCGNYNGDRSDDFRTPKGTVASGPSDFGKSWKVPDRDTKCRDDCEGGCAFCRAQLRKRYEGPQSCGLITLKQGPFRDCHAKVNPKPYLDGCVFDVCLSGGVHDLLCQALKAYAEMCHAAGVRVIGWRTTANCPLTCPENSHYEACGNACPRSCADPLGNAPCRRDCVETCACDPGYVRNSGQCVPASRCGCLHEGRYYEPGETFWKDAECRTWCQCHPLSRKVQCSKSKCGNKERCAVRRGVRGCQPTAYATCSASGDPHYHTFDGVNYNFQGTCIYTLSRLCANGTGLVPYDVRVQNENRGNRRVSYTRQVWVTVHGQTISMSRVHAGRVTVDGELTNLPYRSAGGAFRVRPMAGGGAALWVGEGLRVTYDGRSRVTVRVSTAYAGAVCGLCGNLDGQREDEDSLQGAHWQVATTPGCTDSQDDGSEEICGPQAQLPLPGTSACGILVQEDGPFRLCLPNLPPDAHHRDCLFDACRYHGHATAVCQAVESYAQACQDAGLTVLPWRSADLCPLPCPPHSHYEACGPGCRPTCGEALDPDECELPCAEGCQCDEGYALSGQRCVALVDCGCLHTGRYYRTGQHFYRGTRCEDRCVCLAGGTVACGEGGCGLHEACRMVDNVLGCQPEGQASCQAAGDPHYRSFDGRRFDFQGTCAYVLARTPQNESTLPAFAVHVVNQPYGAQGRVSVTRAVEVVVGQVRLRLEQGLPWKVKLNGVLTNLPLTLDEGWLRAFQHGREAVIQTDFGLKVTYDLVYRLVVTVPGSYRGRMQGLCGDFNGQTDDDFMTPGGSVTMDVDAFGASWKVHGLGAPGCGDGCGDSCPSCSPGRLSVLRRDDYCGVIANAQGPLAACHKAVPPSQFLDNCLYDTCQSGGDLAVFCNSVQAYVAACQAHGVKLKQWRSPSFCPMQCPAHSHYKLCTDTCRFTCAALIEEPKCPDTCVEGCQCDDGFVANGDQCVPLENCGCSLDGLYLQVGEVLVQEGCTQTCSCTKAGLDCQEMSCAADEECRVKAGVLGCFNKNSCKAARCREKEVCKVQGGEATCVPQFTGMCWAWGDPHYHAFDGLSFDFQGTCTYVVTQTCGNDTSLSSFKVTAKNDVRGNTAVSYVQLVNVEVYGLTVSIHKSERGIVRVNGIQTRLPVMLADGRLHLSQQGFFAVLETDFGLKVSYEWRWHLIVTLPSSYYGSTCGLCGNFNGLGQDDMAFPNGTQSPSVLQWAQSWKVEDGDPFCWDHCQGYCPTCSDSDRSLYRGEDYCGQLLVNFQECQDKVDPALFIDSCVYDVCLYQGLHQVLCQALEAYADTCQREGVTVRGWRNAAICPLDCPPNSHYEVCGRACPPTCEDPESSALCLAACVETCACDQGFVLLEGRCQPVSACGCMYEGQTYKPGEVFFPVDGCVVHCVCDAELRMAVCAQVSCRPGETCGAVDGVRGCMPASRATCSASGDPHYTTFAGTRYDFMGTCVYKLSGLCAKRPDLIPFEVRVQNNHRGNTRVSFTKVVTLHIYNTSYELSVDYPSRVLVNGEVRELPINLEDRNLAINRKGRMAEIRASWGLTLTFDWNSHVSLTLPSTYTGAVCGLCGNYPTEAQPDLQLPNGQLAKDPSSFGDAWKVAEVPGCVAGCGKACPTCSEAEQLKYSREENCGKLLRKDGPFQECHAVVNPRPYHQDCMYDLCLFRGRQSILCDILGLYTAACQEAGVKVFAWRSDDFCRLSCPLHSHYELCAPACPDTCYRLLEDNGCSGPCRESCRCDNGFILSGSECLPISHCGCVHLGAYLRAGESFFADDSCRRWCKCGAGGTVQCVERSCQDGEACQVRDGVRGCYPEHRDKCVVSGDPHYLTFGGHAFNFQGSCNYILSKVTSLAPGLAEFEVQGMNRHWGNGRVSVLRRVAVTTASHTFTLEEGIQGKIMVDGEWFTLPLALWDEQVLVTMEGHRAILRCCSGLEVTYDWVHHAEVSVPSSYRGRLAGLCGLYGASGPAEVTRPDGSPTTNVTELGESWLAPGGEAGCDQGCGDRCPACPEDQATRYGSPQSCGLIADPRGPFAACHGTLEPGWFVTNCVFDLCAADGSAPVLCQGLANYAVACQLLGVVIGEWRSNDLCPPTCPANSHYQLCANTCETSCAAIIGPVSCDQHCTEGCQCNDGFALSGSECIPFESCGCIYQRRYFKANETIYTSDCSQACTCRDDGVVACWDAGCQATEDCGLQDGQRGCYPKAGLCMVTSAGVLVGFQGQVGPVGTEGSYLLAEVGPGHGNTPWLRVVGDFRPCNGPAELGITAFYVYFQDLFIVVTRNIIWVNGHPLQEEQLPFQSPLAGLTMSREEEGWVTMELASAARLQLRGSGELRLEVEAAFGKRLRGACGTLGGGKELRLPDGTVAVAICSYYQAWLAEEFSGCSAMFPDRD